MNPLLRVEDLTKIYPVTSGLLKRKVGALTALDRVSFTVDRGETLGIAGESGSGKTTLLRVIARLIDPTSGRVILSLARPNGGGDPAIDIATLDQNRLKQLRRDVQVIFQDANTSLSERVTVDRILREPFEIHGLLSHRERSKRIEELLNQVGLNAGHRNRYPHELSGGQRQRVGIARALALNPTLILADEPVSALDMSVQSQVLNLFEALKRSLHLTLIVVAHDLAVLAHLSDRIAIMYLGRIVELGATEGLFEQPFHPYTEALLASLPLPDPAMRRKRLILKGAIPSPINKPSGCAFHTRCPYVQDRCRVEVPEARAIAPGRVVACHFAEQLSLLPAPRLDLARMGLA
jgi:oligopeptide/dipeptide ABC transporter ATP-binding protein